MSLASRDNGCYECYKRRVKCDKTEPKCLKCLKKGIDCSGQGLRCRFSSHMTQKSIVFKSKPKDGPRSPISLPKEPVETSQPSASSTIVPSSYRWVNVNSGAKARKTRRLGFPRQSVPSALESPEPEPQPSDSSAVDSEEYEDLSVFVNQVAPQPALNFSLNPHARMLFSHFSEFVAPVMVVLDSETNGYRELILPLACQDAVLERAISVVATFHLAQKMPELRQTAEAGHHAIIEKLRRDSLQLRPGEIFSPYVLATILVLLVGETITGADNYGYLLEMLNCFAQTPNALAMLPEGLRAFLWQQIKMFQLFGFPLADETKGLQVLAGPSEYYFEFMAYPHLTQDSSHYENLALIRETIADACSIYRRRVESCVSQDESIHLVEQLRQKVARLGLNVNGAHALVWACFIAGAESTIPEHRKFFSDQLMAFYQYTGFGCIPAAVEALRTLWRTQAHGRWTKVITTDIPILVM